MAGLIKTKFHRAFLLPCLLLSAGLASAGVQLDRVIVYFDADKLPRQDILVTNPDQEPLYLETEIFKVENPGASNEERVRITDPDKMQLLATPGKSIVAPGGRKTVRLVSLNPAPKVEEVYRITFRPVVGELEATQYQLAVGHTPGGIAQRQLRRGKTPQTPVGDADFIRPAACTYQNRRSIIHG